ncbi:MFS transporter [Streptomyces sp. 5-10]|nr:MFS transporter [Streptomyces sp. 5-6(2022)]MBD3003821.1 MFS transporter [Streptomyces sp. 5-10]
MTARSAGPGSGTRKEAHLPHGRPRSFAALEVPVFRLLLAGQSLSMLSYGAYLTMLSWYAYHLGGDAGASGLVLGAVAISTVATLLMGGALADRWDRRRIMIVSDSGRFLTTGTLALLALTDHANMVLLTAFAGVTGLFDGFFAPAFSGLVPLTVSSELIGSANAALGFVRAVCGVCGPLLGGTLYSWAGASAVLALTAASFLVATVTAMALKLPEKLRTAGGGSTAGGPFRDIAEGARYVFSVPLLISIPVAAVALLLSEGPTQTLLPQLVEERLGQGSSGLAALNTAVGAGTALGAFLYARLLPQRRRAVLIYTAWATAHALCAAMALSTSLCVAVAISSVRGVLSGFGYAMWETLLMHVVARDKLSRVFAINMFGTKTLMPIGYGLSGWLAQYSSASTLIVIGQLTAAVLMASLLGSRSIRNVH